MKPIKFNDTSDYQFMEVLDTKGVFTNLRIDRNSLPEGFYKYSMRSGEEEFICEISNEVMVNHAGDFITKTPMDLGPDGRKSLSPDDWGFTDEELDFEEFFGQKYSIDCQIEQAEAKRQEQLGKNPKDRGKSFPLGRDESTR